MSYIFLDSMEHEVLMESVVLNIQFEDMLSEMELNYFWKVMLYNLTM